MDRMEGRDVSRMGDFYRKWTLPKEDKDELTPPQRGFRWFKSKNVVCLEHYRRLRDVTERKVS
jgi:hypothetical protein